MDLDIYQVDAFSNEVFKGNPACVVPLKSWPDDSLLLNIAKENAVAETAFFLMNDNNIHLRWFTPEIEMDLCGHATLAASHIIYTALNFKGDLINFRTKSGNLSVSLNDGLYTLNFPSRKAIKAKLPDKLEKSLNIQPIEVLKSRDYLLIYNTEEDVKNIEINRQYFDQMNLDPGGMIVSAPGKTFDFVSRFFTPQSSILEDPVTGSAHCTLIPYWSEKLNKARMQAEQISERSGQLYCKNAADRVFISGHAKTYSKGQIFL